jgi:uncharacterized repeat protein (TIGR01451 family)
MKGLVWKIALVTAVLAVGFLVILQAQRGMNQAMQQKSDETQAAAQPGATQPSATQSLDAIAATPASPKGDPFGDATPTHDTAVIAPVEPKGHDSKAGDPGSETKPAPALSAPEVAAKESGKPAEKAMVADSREPSAGDPFADGADAKRAAPAGPALEGKGATTNKAEVKQASATSDASSKPADPADTGPAQPATMPDAGQKLPAPGGPSLDDARPDLKSSDAPPKQSEPPGGPQIEPPADPKAPDSKSSAGPALASPGPALELPPSGSGSLPESKGAPVAPDLPGPSGAAGPPPMQLEPSDKPASKAGDPGGPASPASPKLFPEGPKETPLPTPAVPAPNGGTSNPAPSSPPVLDLTPSNSTGSNSTASNPVAASATSPSALPNIPETKSVDATNTTSPSPRAPGDSRSDSPGGATDFQGDGTIGDTAPLGPQRPQLNIEKVAPQNALIGQPLIYSILVKNVGQSSARDVVVEDRIPKGTKLSGTIPRAELTGKKLIWRLGTLGAGEQRKISIRVIPQETGEIGSVATVNFVAEAAAETVVTAPRLEFKISAPASARLGEMVPFHFEVRNVGTGEARGVVIRDLIPQGLSHSAGHDLEYEVGRLMPGKSKQLTLDLKAGKVGTAVNRAVVLAEGGLTTEAKAAIEISGSKIALSRSGPQRRYLGRQAIFTNTLVNESSFAVEGVVLIESIPAGMEFSGATHGGQYNDGNRSIAWRIDPMAPGETRVVKSRLVARGLGNQMCTARVTVPNGEPVEATSRTEVEGFTSLGLDVSGVEGPVDLGEKMTLHINARNKGTVAVTNLVVTVELPEQMEVVSARGPGKTVQEPGRLKFGPVASLEGRTSAACEIVLAARKRGDSRVRVSVQADQIDKPLAREESILILSESAEPTAAAAR